MKSQNPAGRAFVALALAYLSTVTLYINIYCIPPIALSLMRETEIGHFQVGLLMTVYAVVYCFSNLAAGILSDRFGPKAVMCGGLLLGYLATWILSGTSNFTLMVLTRIGIGFSAAAMTAPCMLFVQGWLPPEKKSLGISGHLAALTLGSAAVFLITPILGEGIPWRPLIRIYAAIGAGVLIAFWLFADPPPLGEQGPRESASDGVSGFCSPSLILLSAILFVDMFQIGGTLVWLSPWLEEKCGLPPSGVGVGGMAFSLVGIPASLLGGYLAGKCRQRGKRKGLESIVCLSAVGSILSAATGLLVFFEAPHFFPLIITVIILARWGSFMGVGPRLSIVLELTSQQAVGRALGFVNTVMLSGAFLSSLLSGFFIEKTGEYDLVWVTFAAVLVLSAFVLHPLLSRQLGRAGALQRSGITAGVVATREYRGEPHRGAKVQDK
jgi:predicted MFS family arabinose efflux permease